MNAQTVTAAPARGLYATIGRALAPRRVMTVSEWADTYRWLSSKSSPRPGRWRTNNNPAIREIQDCMSVRSPVQELIAMTCIQWGKSEFEVNVLGYSMTQDPGPIMVCLPGEVSMHKWINQKLNPLIEETAAVRDVLTSTNTRNGANQKDFKDFLGGQLYIEHAGSPQRLKQTTVKRLLVDEFTEFATALKSGDDPAAMLDGRTSAYPHRAKRAYVSTPGVRGLCRTAEKWGKSDQRRYHVQCPHCRHAQPLEWDGLKWKTDRAGNVINAFYVCRDCGSMIEEHHKPQMLKDVPAGGTARWVPTHPDRTLRGYHINCLYYQIGMGPGWAALAQMWLDAQGDPAKLKTFINDRLAEPWEDRSLKAVKSNILQDRAEGYALRTAPHGVIWITAGVDTQDNRLEVQIIGWGRGLMAWTLDYAVLWGDPLQDDVWVQLVDLLNRPIEHACGALLPISATAIDGRGHRTLAVKDFVRKALIRRPMAIFGAKAANALPLSRPKLEDVNHKGKTDAGSIWTFQVGTVAIKHHFFRRLASDAEQDDPAKRWVHFPEMPREYFAGLVSETFDPVKGLYRKRAGARNEPLDTHVYAYAATHHPELRLHRRTKAEWDADEKRILESAGIATADAAPPAAPAPAGQPAPGSPSAARSSQSGRRSVRSNYLA